MTDKSTVQGRMKGNPATVIVYSGSFNICGTIRQIRVAVKADVTPARVRVMLAEKMADFIKRNPECLVMQETHPKVVTR